MIPALCDDEVDNGMSGPQFTLKDAEACAYALTASGANDIRIWALDVARNDGTIGKCFYVASVVGLFTYLVSDTCKNYRWYEVISAAHPVKFHLDVEVERVDPSRYDNENKACCARKRLVEMDLEGAELNALFAYCCEVSGEDWSEEECVYGTYFVRKALVSFFSRNFPQFQNENKIEPVILTGSRPSKFSLHILVGEVILDRGYISCRYLAWEFARTLWSFIENGFQRYVVDDDGTRK
jgi:hypothetical protein